jgi:hypothetical protein
VERYVYVVVDRDRDRDDDAGGSREGSFVSSQRTETSDDTE